MGRFALDQRSNKRPHSGRGAGAKRGQSARTITGALKGALVPYSSGDESSQDLVNAMQENGAVAQNLFNQNGALGAQILLWREGG